MGHKKVGCSQRGCRSLQLKKPRLLQFSDCKVSVRSWSSELLVWCPGYRTLSPFFGRIIVVTTRDYTWDPAGLWVLLSSVNVPQELVGPLPSNWKTLPFAHQGISLRAFSFGRVPMSIRDVKEKPGKGVCCSGGAVRAARDPPEALVKLPVWERQTSCALELPVCKRGHLPAPTTLCDHLDLALHQCYWNICLFQLQQENRVWGHVLEALGLLTGARTIFFPESHYLDTQRENNWRGLWSKQPIWK